MSFSRLAAFLLLVVPVALSAQESPFHQGQWGAQFTGGLSLSSLGVIKFRSATSATVMDLRIAGVHREEFLNDTVSEVVSQFGVDMRLGRRRYRPVADKVVVLHSLGVLAGLNHSLSRAPFGGTFRSNGWQLGPFVDLGAVYLVSPHLGIGATGSATLTYSRVSSKAPAATTASAWQLGGGTSITFAATLYF
ncbi:MAG TPA: hypothetical protein VGJ83_05360 [Gemmatimonadales bacterium]